jgi:hypothetical protein
VVLDMLVARGHGQPGGIPAVARMQRRFAILAVAATRHGLRRAYNAGGACARRRQQAMTRSWPGMWSVSGLCGHFVQPPQQPQPAREADLLARVGLVSLLGIDNPKTARRRLGPVQDNADLHMPTVSALAARNISQLADACPAGAAAP